MVPVQTLAIVVLADGDKGMIYNESIDLRRLGRPQTRRGSRVEATRYGPGMLVVDFDELDLERFLAMCGKERLSSLETASRENVSGHGSVFCLGMN